jgi:hypothetical protein
MNDSSPITNNPVSLKPNRTDSYINDVYALDALGHIRDYMSAAFCNMLISTVLLASCWIRALEDRRLCVVRDYTCVYYNITDIFMQIVIEYLDILDYIVMYGPTAGQERDKYFHEVSSQQQKDIHC